MAADVLLGNDRDAARWIRAHPRRAAGGRGRAAGDVNRRRARRPRRPALTRRWPPEAEPLVIFTPSGRRGRFATGTTVLDAARALGVDIDSVCGGARDLRPLPGRAERRHLPQARHRVRSPAHLRRSARSRPSTGAEQGAGGRAPAALHGPRPRRRRRRRPAREPGLSPGRPQGPRAARPSHRPGRPPPLRRGHASPTWRRRPGTSAGCSDALETEWGLTDLGADLSVVRALQPALEKGNYAVTVAVHDGRDDHRGLAGLPRPGATGSRSTSARRRSPATSRTSPTARSSPATA